MTVPTTEILIFETSDSFRANPELLVPTFERLREEGVNVPCYSGLEAENPNVGFIFINWDSYEHHKEVAEAPFYPGILKGLEQAFASPPKAYHVQFPAPPAALDHPITTFLSFSLKKPENRAAVVDLMTNFMAAGKERMLVFEQTLEDKDKYIFIGGWPSVEAHWEATAKHKVATETKTLLLSLVDEDNFYHAKLKRY